MATLIVGGQAHQCTAMTLIAVELAWDDITALANPTSPVDQMTRFLRILATYNAVRDNAGKTEAEIKDAIDVELMKLKRVATLGDMKNLDVAIVTWMKESGVFNDAPADPAQGEASATS